MAFDPNGKVVAILGATGVVGAQMMQCLERLSVDASALITPMHLEWTQTFRW